MRCNENIFDRCQRLKAAYEKIELSSRWYIKCFFKSTYWNWKILNIQLGE